MYCFQVLEHLVYSYSRVSKFITDNNILCHHQFFHSVLPRPRPQIQKYPETCGRGFCYSHICAYFLILYSSLFSLFIWSNTRPNSGCTRHVAQIPPKLPLVSRVPCLAGYSTRCDLDEKFFLFLCFPPQDSRSALHALLCETGETTCSTEFLQTFQVLEIIHFQDKRYYSYWKNNLCTPQVQRQFNESYLVLRSSARNLPASNLNCSFYIKALSLKSRTFFSLKLFKAWRQANWKED